MKQYIDKSALVAEIESLERTTFTNFDEGVNAAVQTILEVINTLEVKEVDMQKAFENGFDAGRADAIELIWHKKTECPTRKTTCILIATHGGFMARERIEQMEDWQRWAYIEDLLPNIPEPLEVVKGFYMEELKEGKV